MRRRPAIPRWRSRAALIGAGAIVCVALTTASATAPDSAALRPGTIAATTPSPTSTTTATTSTTMPSAATSTSSTTSTSTTSTATTATSTSSTTPTTAASTTSTMAPSPSSSSTSTSSTSPASSTSSVAPLPLVPQALPGLAAAFAALTAGNVAGSLTVVRDHAVVARSAFGATLDGRPVTTATPLVLASVSKLITAETVAKLVEAGRIDLDAPVPWTALGLDHDPAWETVTVRELLTHTSGMPVARASWLTDPGSCATPLEDALSRPPRPSRGTWVYSNGNYCALGLLVEHVTGQQRDVAARHLVLAPLHLGDAHLTSDPPLPGDGPYPQGLARLDRLGGAGTWMASTDTVAAMIDATTPADRATLAYPATFTDQYGWGHTGTLDGAKACLWQLDGGRTTLAAVIAGNRPSSGGQLCDRLVPALAGDLGLGTAKPVRLPE